MKKAKKTRVTSLISIIVALGMLCFLFSVIPMDAYPRFFSIYEIIFMPVFSLAVIIISGSGNALEKSIAAFFTGEKLEGKVYEQAASALRSMRKVQLYAAVIVFTVNIVTYLHNFVAEYQSDDWGLPFLGEMLYNTSFSFLPFFYASFVNLFLIIVEKTLENRNE